jgi:hypothetical protein
MISADLFFDAKEAPRDAVEEDVEVVGLVDLASCPT